MKPSEKADGLLHKGEARRFLQAPDIRKFLVRHGWALMLASCAYPGGDYQGYMTRSYTVRGGTYHPMGVEEAIYHVESGTASLSTRIFLVWLPTSVWMA